MRMTLDLDRLPRVDLEALAAFKLWAEMRIDPGECRGAIVAADQEWLLAFLKHSGLHIAMAPLDGALLSLARSHAGA
jgi:hypothetical protein